MHVPPSGRGLGAARRLTPRPVRSRQRGFELFAGLGQSTLCSASNPCPLTYHFVSRPPTRASMVPFGLSSSYVCFVSLCVCFVFSYVCVVYVCLVCENPGIDVVLTCTVSLLWSGGDRHRRVAVRRSLSIQGHTCKAPFGVHVPYIRFTYMYRYTVGAREDHAVHADNIGALSLRMVTA